MTLNVLLDFIFSRCISNSAFQAVFQQPVVLKAPQFFSAAAANFLFGGFSAIRIFFRRIFGHRCFFGEFGGYSAAGGGLRTI